MSRMRMPPIYTTFGGATDRYQGWTHQFNNRWMLQLPTRTSNDNACYFHPDHPVSGVQSKLGLASLTTSWGLAYEQGLGNHRSFYVPGTDEVWKFGVTADAGGNVIIEALVVNSSMTASRVSLGAVETGTPSKISGVLSVIAQHQTSPIIYIVVRITDSSVFPFLYRLRLCTVNCSAKTMTVSDPLPFGTSSVPAGDLVSGVVGAVLLGDRIVSIGGAYVNRIGISSPPTFAQAASPFGSSTPTPPVVANGAGWWGWSNGYNRWVRSFDGVTFNNFDPNPVGGFPLSTGGSGVHTVRWQGDGNLYWFGQAITTVFPATAAYATCFRIDPSNPADADVVGGWHAGYGEGWTNGVCMDKATGNAFSGTAISSTRARIGGLAVDNERAAPNPQPGRVLPLEQGGQVAAGTAQPIPIQRLDEPFILFRTQDWDGGPVLANQGNGGDVFDLNVYSTVGVVGSQQIGAFNDYDTFRNVSQDNFGGVPVTGPEAKPFTIICGIGEMPDSDIWSYYYTELLCGALNFRMSVELDARPNQTLDHSWYLQAGSNFYMSGSERRVVGASFPDVPDLPGRLVVIVIDVAQSQMAFFIDGVSFHPNNYTNTVWRWPGDPGTNTSLRCYSASAHQSVATPSGPNRLYLDVNRASSALGTSFDPLTNGGFPWSMRLLSIHRGQPDTADMAYWYGTAFDGVLPVALRGASASWTWSGIVAVPEDTQFSTQYAPGPRTIIGLRLTLGTADVAPQDPQGGWDLVVDLYVGGALIGTATLAAGQTTTTQTVFTNPAIADADTPVWAVLRREPDGQGYDLTVDVIWEE